MSRRAKNAAVVYVLLGLMQRSLALLLLPLVSRALTPSEYGLVATVVVSASVFNVVLAGPLEIGLFRGILTSRSHLAGVERASRIYLCYALPLLTAMLCAGLWFSELGPPDVMRLWVMELMAASFLAGVSSYGLTVARAQDLLLRFASVSLMSMTSLVLLKVVLVFLLDYGPTGWIVSDVVSAAATWLLVQFILVPGRRRRESRPSAWRNSAVAAAALVPHRFSFWALASFSRPLVAVGFGSADAGLYAMAFSLATVATLVLSELNNAMLVSYARDAESGEVEATKAALRVQTSALLVVPAIGAVATWILAPFLLGPAFQAAVPLMGGMVAGQCLYGVYVIPMNLIIHRTGRPGLSSVASGIGAMVTVIAILFAAYADSLWLAAAAPSLGYGTMAGVAWLLAVRNRSFPIDIGIFGPMVRTGGYASVVVPVVTLLLFTPVASWQGWALATTALVACLAFMSSQVEWRRRLSQSGLNE